MYPYPMSYSEMPYMAYAQPSARPAVMPLSMSTYPIMASDSPRSKPRYFQPSFPQAGLYMANPHVSPYGFDSQGFAYAIPVPLVPYVKRYSFEMSLLILCLTESLTHIIQ